jgi:hypothetical protein
MFSTEHKGYNVVLGDDEKTWLCHELNLQAQSLAEIKKRIDEIGKSERRVNVEVLMVERGYWDNEPRKIRRVLVTLLEEGKYFGEMSNHCWIKDEGKISKVHLSEVFPLDQMPSNNGCARTLQLAPPLSPLMVSSRRYRAILLGAWRKRRRRISVDNSGGLPTIRGGDQMKLHKAQPSMADIAAIGGLEELTNVHTRRDGNMTVAALRGCDSG